MGQAARMLWDPRSIRTEGRAESGGFVDDARTWAQPLHTIPLYVLGVIGARRHAAANRRPLRRAARLQHARRARVRGGDPLPRPVGLRARARRGGGDRLAPRSLETGAVRVTHVHRIGGIGGSERHLLTLLPALAAKGVDVRFVGLDMPGADPFYAELDVPFERLDPAVAAPRGRATRAAGSRAHAPRSRRRLRRGRDAHADRLDEAQPRPVSYRAVALRGARTGLARHPDRRHQRRRAALQRGGSGAARGQGRGHPLRARRACPSPGPRTRRCRSPTALRCCSASRGSRHRRASTRRFARCRRFRTRRCSCSAKGPNASGSRRLRESSA